MILSPGKKVRVKTPNGICPAFIVGIDNDHYHARVNCRVIYRIRFTDGKTGSGWEVNDFVY